MRGWHKQYLAEGWDVDMRHENGQWVPYAFKGTKWQNIGAEKRRIYQLNAYRVLLTRARQGMVIFIPEGDPNDPTLWVDDPKASINLAASRKPEVATIVRITLLENAGRRLDA